MKKKHKYNVEIRPVDPKNDYSVYTSVKAGNMQDAADLAEVLCKDHQAQVGFALHVGQITFSFLSF